MTPDGAERRRSRRYPVKLRVVYRRAGATLAVEGETENLSLEGTLVRTDGQPLDVGTEVLLLLKHGEGLMLSGVVVRVSTGDEPNGMGIRFKDLTEEMRAALSEALSTTSSS